MWLNCLRSKLSSVMLSEHVIFLGVLRLQLDVRAGAVTDANADLTSLKSYISIGIRTSARIKS